MESIQHIKKRMRSVANIEKITKAMELVAATKMRRSQEIALASRPYAFAALDLLARVALESVPDQASLPELLKPRQVQRVLFVLVASDKGLAGAFNSALFKKFERYLANLQEQYKNEERIFVAVGEKASQYLARKKASVAQAFLRVGDFTDAKQVQPIADFLIQGYLERRWDRVVVFSTHFVSALKQEPMVRRVLPLSADYIEQSIREILPETGKFSDLMKTQQLDFTLAGAKPHNYLMEPSFEIVSETLVRHLLFMQVYHLILEANAAEHSARRLAMKTASDNASDLGFELNLQYNKSRQAGITNQIIEISAGAEALA